MKVWYFELHIMALVSYQYLIVSENGSRLRDSRALCDQWFGHRVAPF